MCLFFTAPAVLVILHFARKKEPDEPPSSNLIQQKLAPETSPAILSQSITVYAKAGSQPHPYAVSFILKKTTLSIVCECRAGEEGMQCKHKVALVKGDRNMLAEVTRDAAKLAEALILVGRTELLAKIGALEAAFVDLAKLEDRIKDLKRELGRLMSDGSELRRARS